MDRWIALVVVIAVPVVWFGNALATGKGDPPAEMDLPVWMKMTEEHRHLAESVGEYDAHLKVWMAPGTEPMEFTGKATRKAIHGGFFVEETFSSSWMGQPYQGRLIEGFDTVRREFFSIWIDSSGPMASHSRGTVEDGILKMAGTGPDRMTGKPKRTRYEVKALETGHRMSMWDVTDSGSQKTMEITYVKTK